MRPDERWSIESLHVSGFRSFESLDLNFDEHVTLLVGENGKGKTAVLDVLRVMLSTAVIELGGDHVPFSHNDVRRVTQDLGSSERTASSDAIYPLFAELDAYVAGDRFRWERRVRGPGRSTTTTNPAVRKWTAALAKRAYEGRTTTDREQVLPVIASYGVERLVGQRQARGEIPSSRRGAYESALDPRSDLTRLASFLEALDSQVLAAHAYGDEQPTAAMEQFRAIEAACASVLEPVGWHSLRWNRAINALTLSHPQHGTLPLTALASGPKIVAGLALDLASRMARANPHLGANALLARTPGIVLIDEVDLHLHPTWQKQIVPALVRTFPRVQFVLTTHSPHVIATVASENIRILTDNGVHLPAFSLGLRPEVILEEVQGTDPVPDVEVRHRLDQYLAAVHAGEGRSTAMRALRAELDERLGGASRNSELTQADAFLLFSDQSEER